MAGRTVVLVAHRLRTVQSADHIVYVADGQIKEQGTHEELLSRNGHYAAYWNLTMTPSE
jgi:ATP-binding cassette subfamily B protein